MACTGNIIISFDQCINLAKDQMTPEEVRAIGDRLACQMEAIETEEWTKNLSAKWDINLPFNKSHARTIYVIYTKRFISVGDFLQELDLISRQGFRIEESTVFLVDNEQGGIIWKNEK